MLVPWMFEGKYMVSVPFFEAVGGCSNINCRRVSCFDLGLVYKGAFETVSIEGAVVGSPTAVARWFRLTCFTFFKKLFEMILSMFGMLLKDTLYLYNKFPCL